jgi:hypothetical protein
MLEIAERHGQVFISDRIEGSGLLRAEALTRQQMVNFPLDFFSQGLGEYSGSFNSGDPVGMPPDTT